MLGLAGCSDGSDSDKGKPTSPPAKDYLNAPATGLVAVIRRTTNGVPYVKADNLESAAFGVGYAQAQDNVCVLADAFVKARSERALYFGPGSGNIHVIYDFSYKAQRVLSGASAEYAAMSAEGKALIKGFVAGYNKYLRETPKANLPVECRNAPWVFEITVNDLVAHLRILAGYASGDLFATGALLLGVPPGVDPNPAPAAAAGLGWQIAYGTTWHVGLSPSTNSSSPYFSDQIRRYSDKNMRAIPFSEEEIAAALVSGGETTIRP